MDLIQKLAAYLIFFYMKLFDFFTFTASLEDPIIMHILPNIKSAAIFE